MAQKFAYVGCRTTRERNARGKGISLYQICPLTAAWNLVDVFPTLDNPSFLALNRAQTHLYTVHGDGEHASSLRIDATSGRLTHLNTVSCNGSPSQHWTLANGQVVGIGGKCLDSLGGTEEEGVPLTITTCNGSPSQQWQVH